MRRVAGGLWSPGASVYFVGTDDSGLVTLYRGVPYDLPLGVKLYSTDYTSGVPAAGLPARRRQRVLDHKLRSQGATRSTSSARSSWTQG